MRTVCILSLVLLLFVAGCSNDAQVALDPSVEGSTSGDDRVLHIVMVTEGLQPDQYEVAIAPWKERTYREVWIDLVSGDIRESSMTTPTTTQVGGTHWNESLVSDGVLTAYGWSEYPNIPSLDATTAFVIDSPENGLPYGRWDPIVESRDADVFRSLVESGAAQVSTPPSGDTDLRLVTVEESTIDGSKIQLEVIVDAKSYMPIESDGQRWQEDPEGSDRQVVTRRWHTTYELIEIIPKDEVPNGTFSIPIPENTPTHIDRTLSVDEASELEEPSVYWIGSSWGDQGISAGPRLLAEENSDMRGFGLWGTPNFFGSQDTREWIDHMMPFKDRIHSIVTIEYGDEHSGPTVYSTNRFNVEKATELYASGPAFDVETHTSEGRKMTSIMPTDGLSVLWVVVDMPNATVILQGWQMTLDETLAAAEALVRVGSE